MKKGIWIGIVLLFMSTALYAGERAKETSGRTMTVAVAADTVFDKTIDFLQDNGYFILSVDKMSGFVQAKKAFREGKLFAAREGRRILDFIVRPDGEQKSRIRLAVYEEVLQSGGNWAGVYYEDRGISEDASLYEGILEGLRKAL